VCCCLLLVLQELKRKLQQGEDEEQDKLKDARKDNAEQVRAGSSQGPSAHGRHVFATAHAPLVR
jgi:hypothetical protein